MIYIILFLFICCLLFSVTVYLQECTRQRAYCFGLFEAVEVCSSDEKRAHSLNLKAFEQIFMVFMVVFRILDPNPHHQVTRNQGIRLLDHRTHRNYGDRWQRQFLGCKALPRTLALDHPSQSPRYSLVIGT